MPSGAERRVPFWGFVVAVTVVDRLTKFLAAGALANDRVIAILGQTVQLRLVHNTGAAFGLHLGPWSRWIFTVIAIVAIWFLHRESRRSRPGDLLRQWSLGIVAGGAAGNLVDRLLTSRGVIDFIDIGVGTLRWPTFNVADICVSCGAIVLAFSLWREDVQRAATSTR